jgi:UDP-2,3-diacylglucosamine pyrophosphatase LpxH
MKIKTALIIPDCHIPYHDERAYNLMLKVGKSVNPNEIVLLGDYADFYAVNSHGKSGKLLANLKTEVNAVNQKLDELDGLFPKANKVFLEGNHEFRLERFLNDKAPELFDCVNVPHLFKLKERKNWKFVEYGPEQKYKVLKSKLYARHEPLGGGANVANTTVTKCGGSVIFGHVHRIQEYQTVMIDGGNHRGITCGWLGDHRSEVMKYIKGHHQWAQGFSVVTVLPDGTFYAQTIHIINYKCVYGGKVFVG